VLGYVWCQLKYHVASSQRFAWQQSSFSTMQATTYPLHLNKLPLQQSSYPAAVNPGWMVLVASAAACACVGSRPAL
jgi:hypothetical protein